MMYLIVGRTASGKDYLAKEMARMGMRVVKSYTTRPRRTPDEDSHIFITMEEALKMPEEDKAISTTIKGNLYFARKQDIAHDDVYIIDPVGVFKIIEEMPDMLFEIIYVKAADAAARREAFTEREADQEKADTLYDERYKAEDEQFTAFEELIADSSRYRECFHDRIHLVYTVENDYQPGTLSQKADQFVTEKHLHDNLTAFVEEAIERDVLYGDEKVVRLVCCGENGEYVTQAVSHEEMAQHMRIDMREEKVETVFRSYMQSRDVEWGRRAFDTFAKRGLFPETLSPYKCYRDVAFSVEEFITMAKRHAAHFIGYCECVILPTGYILLAAPSHEQVLLSLLAEPYQHHIRQNMADLLEATGCVSVWYNYHKAAGHLTAAQRRVLDELKTSGLVMET